MSDSRITPGVVYKAVLLAFALVIAAMIFHALASLILGLLIVVIIATPLAAFADLLERYHCPRAIGATLGLLIGLAAVAGLVALIVPVFTREVNDFAHSLPTISDSLTRRLGRLTGSSPAHITSQVQHFVNSYTHNPSKLLGPVVVDPHRGLTIDDTSLHGSLRVPVALIDRPYDQRRDPMWLSLDASAGHVVIVGGPRSGKSTLVRSLICGLALTHTPREVTCYCLDFGGGALASLRDLPHVGAVVARLVPEAVRQLTQHGVTVHGDKRAAELAEVVPAVDADWDTEYLSLDIAMRVVDSLDEAVEHIGEHGSGHTEAIVSDDVRAAREFVARVDAAAVMVNAATSFNDGGEMGMGAEIGISTQKLHARGPMGLAELTSTKWVVWGDGHVRASS